MFEGFPRYGRPRHIPLLRFMKRGCFKPDLPHPWIRKSKEGKGHSHLLHGFPSPLVNRNLCFWFKMPQTKENSSYFILRQTKDSIGLKIDSSDSPNILKKLLGENLKLILFAGSATKPKIQLFAQPCSKSQVKVPRKSKSKSQEPYCHMA